MKIAHKLPAGTEADVLDMVAKALLMRQAHGPQPAVVVTWEDLERAAATPCELVECAEGILFRSEEPSLQ